VLQKPYRVGLTLFARDGESALRDSLPGERAYAIRK
jgi:hypothetical protein